MLGDTICTVDGYWQYCRGIPSVLWIEHVSNIMSATWRSVLWRADISTVDRYHQYWGDIITFGGYHQYYGGYSILLRDSISTVDQYSAGDIISTAEDVNQQNL